jgi:alpha-1,2-mannosyltransferase
MSSYIRVAAKFARWLTPRRVLAQAVVLAAGLWILAALDFATPGVMDRGGNVKFQDFLQFYLGGMLVRQGRASELFDWQTAMAQMHAIAPAWKFGLPMVYGPQVALWFAPFARLSFMTAATIWVAISSVLYLVCCYLAWKTCPALSQHARLFWLLTLAYPPFFHFVVRGQLSALVLVCFAAGYVALRANRPFLAGIALGCLAFKPQFLLAIPVVFLLAGAWRAFAGTIVAAGGQLGLTWAWFGRAVMRKYAITLANLPRLVAATEGAKAHAQMHSLRSFWSLLVPWPGVALVLYILSSIVVLAWALRSWRADGPLSLRFSALVLASVLINPHLFVYDLLVLAPVLILLGDWILHNRSHSSAPVLRMLVYGAYVLPLLGPLTLVTHVQLSVIVFVLLQWELRSTNPAPVLASAPATVSSA